MDRESIKILEFIRDNPLCESGGMDGFTLKDLKGMGYVDAIDVTTDDNNGIPEFIEMRITLPGKNAISEHHQATDETGSVHIKSDNWHNMPLGKIAIGTISAVLATFILILFAKNFGISL
ncbi:hypothetical protein [Shewanella colwelliana]|uniref:hypothetical protein n=1 Tax=Shewanella colwelliana TaxID=23 RepID=UPI0022AF87AE|nr:hypothetical protein [Shewanella colwelliana]MCZ4339751.1 hypothetical protein [Shewanella colwelliana]